MSWPKWLLSKIPIIGKRFKKKEKQTKLDDWEGENNAESY
jgi:hypothetical protein